MINADVLNACKKGVKIINVGRGGLIQERDLLDALKTGQVILSYNIIPESATYDNKQLSLKVIAHFFTSNKQNIK